MIKLAMINDYKKVKECVYKGEHYSVRDNGAVLRYPKEGQKPRKLDGKWTFGRKSIHNGYMHIGSSRVHIIVATAFYGARDSKVYVVDHIDTNRCNNRVENLRWFTRLENAINNEITRYKIIAICGSIDAFIENPSILHERMGLFGEPSLEWMRTVTREEAFKAYENLKKFWAEQAKRPKQLAGGKLNDSVYRKQLNVSEKQINAENITTPISSNDKSDFLVSNEEWEKMTQSLRQPYPDETIDKENEEPEDEFELGSKYVMSQTPRAAQRRNMEDRLYYYPSTPQFKSDSPLKVYFETLTPGKVFWRNHEGKRDYIVEKRDYSIEGNSLVIMLKAGYIWGSDNKGESVEIPLSALSETDYDDRQLNRQLYEVVYKNGVYYHIRVERGFLPREYLEDIYKEMTVIES